MKKVWTAEELEAIAVEITNSGVAARCHHLEPCTCDLQSGALIIWEQRQRIAELEREIGQLKAKVANMEGTLWGLYDGRTR